MVELRPPAGLALGTAQWGMDYGIANETGPPDDDQLRAILQLAGEAHLDTLDTARAYGSSENRIGQCVGRDRRWKVYTKLAADAWQEGIDAEQAATRAHDSLATSRVALCRTRLDAVLLHRASHRHVAGGAIWSVLRDEVQRGQIEAIGISASAPEDAYDALEDESASVIQIACNLLDQRLVRSGFLDLALRRGRKVVIRSIFLQGLAHLDPAALPAHLEPLRPVLRDLATWASRYNLQTSDIFLGFAHLLRGATVLVGCEHVTQLADNLAAWERTRRLVAEIGHLAISIPSFSDGLINPARWPNVA